MKNKTTIAICLFFVLMVNAFLYTDLNRSGDELNEIRKDLAEMSYVEDMVAINAMVAQLESQIHFNAQVFGSANPNLSEADGVSDAVRPEDFGMQRVPRPKAKVAESVGPNLAREELASWGGEESTVNLAVTPDQNDSEPRTQPDTGVRVGGKPVIESTPQTSSQASSKIALMDNQITSINNDLRGLTAMVNQTIGKYNSLFESIDRKIEAADKKSPMDWATQIVGLVSTIILTIIAVMAFLKGDGKGDAESENAGGS